MLGYKPFHYFNEVDTLAKLSSRLLVSFFRELDTRSGTMLTNHVSFFNEVATRLKLSSRFLVSFFRELDTRSGTMLQPILGSFFKELDIGK